MFLLQELKSRAIIQQIYIPATDYTCIIFPIMNDYLRADISVSAIRHNIGVVQGLLSGGAGLCPVVKANAYGHGIAQVLGVLGSAADMLAVATGTEAMRLRESGWERPVLIFATAAADGIEGLVELIVGDVTLTVTSPDELSLLAEAAGKARRPAGVHIKIDTGMNRSGVPAGQAAQLVSAVRESEHVNLTGMYTHFACADDADKTSTLEQFQRFMQTVDECGGRSGLMLHAANSAATIDLSETHLDMVRTGLALYGYNPCEESPNALPLKPALRLTGPIVQIKDVPSGSATGYGLTYTFTRDARIALVPVGYADGYPRSLSNVASMRVRGIDCPVRGRVSMDQTVIAITDVPDAAIGDEVEIISPDPSAINSILNLARQADTIPYEILSRLGTNRIKRVVVD
jgi:alanine racemase